LIEAVRKGRREEFASFKWTGEPPDPQAEETFRRSKLNHDLKTERRHHTLLEYHQELIRLRKTLPALRSLSKEKMDVVSFADEHILEVRRWSGNSEVLAIFSFNDRAVRLAQSLPHGLWRKQLDSAEPRWMGPGTTVPDVMDSATRLPLTVQPHSVLLFEKEFED
jgi:maltooligosyltrehalose trehalohydrolase